MSQAATTELETALAGVELQLGRLADALQQRDLAAVEPVASGLQRELADTLDRFARHQRAHGGLPAALRQRLVLAAGRVSAQRASLARASTAMDRALQILMPGDGPLYTPQGHAAHQRPGGSLRA